MRKGLMTMLALCFLMISLLSGGMLANAETEHAFTIPANKGIGTNTQSTKTLFRGTTDTGNPWKVRMTITTDTFDRTTIYWLQLNDGTGASAYLHVQHGNNYYTQSPYAIANQKYVRLMARDNNDKNGAYWTAGQWAATSW